MDKCFLKTGGRCMTLSRSTKDRYLKMTWTRQLNDKGKKEGNLFVFACFLEGYTQWKLEDNKNKRSLRAVWHLPVNSGRARQHTRRRGEESRCLPGEGQDTCEWHTSSQRIKSSSPVSVLIFCYTPFPRFYRGSIRRAKRPWRAAVSRWSA